MKFSDLGLSLPVLRALEAAGYDAPTPIQAQAIPHVLAGRDLFGCAQTGTGKTAAFALPMLDRLAGSRAAQGAKRKTRALVLTPTRELASQIESSFTEYGRYTGLRCAVVFGGVGMQRQIDMLARGVDILVATPGRLLDLMQQRAVSFADVRVFVLDEADRMLDMGFVNDVMRIARSVPKERQTLMFSATLPEGIRAIAKSLLTEPVHVAVDAESSAAETLDQSVYFVDKADKRALLAWVLQDLEIDRTLAFTRTKHGADRVVEFLQKRGIASAALHGNKSQNARERALAAFKDGKLRVLVATDIAARGIDIERLSHVINYEVPNTPESYVHRIGRSGRAGMAGVALSFCDAEERPYLRSIERLIQMPIRVVGDHPHPPTHTEHAAPSERGRSGHARGGKLGQPGNQGKQGKQGRQQRQAPSQPRRGAAHGGERSRPAPQPSAAVESTAERPLKAGYSRPKRHRFGR